VKPPVEPLIEAIASICHEANRAWCDHWGSDVQVPWKDAPQWQKDSAVDGVRFIVDCHKRGFKFSAEDVHEHWRDKKFSDGWKWAAIKNPANKEHNCLLPWSELNPKERLKDELFLGIVSAFLE